MPRTPDSGSAPAAGPVAAPVVTTRPPGPVRGRRRSRDWIRVTHGVHRPAGSADLRDELLAWQLVLPSASCVTGLTAARLLGWWLPPLPADLPVFVSMPRGRTPPDRPGLRVTRHPRRIDHTVHPDGLRVASAPEILLAGARWLSPLDLLVLVDCALHRSECTRDDLLVAAGARRWGAPRLRQAVEIADGRSESAWETLLRRLHESCDVAVEPQRVLCDGDGTFVARGDLWLVGTRDFHEYDGGHHLDRSQQRRDLSRTRRIDATGSTRRGYTKEDVLHHAVGILRDADASLGRPHDPARIRAWHGMLRESLFTPAGTEEFRRRLGLAESESVETRPA